MDPGRVMVPLVQMVRRAISFAIDYGPSGWIYKLRNK